MNDELNDWISSHVEELRLVAEYGRTDTIRAQAQAFLRIANIEENGEGEEGGP